MKNIPRILPLIGVAVGGVLAINALSGAKSLPDLVSGAKAFAEGAATPEGKEGEGAPSAEGAAQPAAAKAPALTPVKSPASDKPALEGLKATVGAASGAAS